MSEEKIINTLHLLLTQMEAQQQALVKLTEVLDKYLKDPVRVDVVANAPKVSLTENNSVGINPQNNHVVVDNFPPPEIRDRNAPGVEVFQRQIDVSTNGNDAEKPVNSPDGRRLVIEYVSLLSQQNATIFLRTVANGVSVKHAALGLVRIYADPGTSVFLRVERAGGSGFPPSPVSASVAVSGHLVQV